MNLGFSAPHTTAHTLHLPPRGATFAAIRDKLPTLDVAADYANRLEPFAQRMTLTETGQVMSAEQAQRALEAHYACVDFVDDCIGEIINGLDLAWIAAHYWLTH